MNRYVSYIVSAIMVAPLIGCGPRVLNPEAENVRITTATPSKCKFIGVINKSDVHGNMSLFPTEQEMTLDHKNFLKNQAVKLGGNVVVFKSPIRRKELHTVYNKVTPGITHELTVHDVIASIYLCPR